MSHTKSQDRADRLKAALRENLKRRKVQARGREATDRASAEEAGDPASGKRRPE